ncbi:amidase [Propylenella binzhouense]|uniref:Amidase n=1 Tax=Propylenella binzhouense TaxID=2555902 RepID=A0A964T634_9HYPH|nr:amidase [Propylenella binzhouense]MYZ49110.1 amidase [Propylenella binzhouense]
MQPTLQELAAGLEAGRLTSRGLVEACFARIADEDGEGARVFTRTHRAAALAAADAMDGLRRAGLAPSAYAGIPISVKDLFDLAGEPTPAGSKILADAAPAEADAPAIARLRRAGFVVVGRTNMTEFAFSGLGLNPHYGTPLNPYDRAVGRIPGGSTSGGAVSVTDGMAHGAIGTDTGGSCRIPAAMTGLVGFKPTAARVPLAGAFPLSPSLDSVGPLTRTVACAAALDAVMAGAEPDFAPREDLAGLRLAVPQTLVLQGMDQKVADDFDRALSKLARAGARVVEIDLAAVADMLEINAKGGFPAAEAFAAHRSLIAEKADGYDPRVLLRIRRGEAQTAADYIDLLAARRRYREKVLAGFAAFDALVFPTVPIVAPTIAELEDDQAFTAVNLLVLRNPTVVNMIDACAVSVPMHEAGTAPTGLMLVGRPSEDGALLAQAAAAEAVLSPRI